MQTLIFIMQDKCYVKLDTEPGEERVVTAKPDPRNLMRNFCKDCTFYNFCCYITDARLT